jgi:hypothetical protein
MYYFVVGVAILPANLAFGAVWDEWGEGAAFGGSATVALLAAGMLLRIRTGASSSFVGGPERKESG